MCTYPPNEHPRCGCGGGASTRRPMTLQSLLDQIAGQSVWVGLGLLILATMKIKPAEIPIWDWLKNLPRYALRALGRYLNAEVLDRLDKVEAAQNATRAKLDEHIVLADAREADGWRASILRYNVELIQHVPHTREDFIEILVVIDDYEDYCDTHPDYENNRAVFAIANIKRVYAERLQKGFKEDT